MPFIKIFDASHAMYMKRKTKTLLKNGVIPTNFNEQEGKEGKERESEQLTSKEERSICYSSTNMSLHKIIAVKKGRTEEFN